MWTVAADQLLSEEDDLSPVVTVGRKKRQFGKSEWAMQFYFLKSILYQKRHAARGLRQPWWTMNICSEEKRGRAEKGKIHLGH